ncbi:uncharacterized protein LOC132260415 [Phlebotomus argentipes]|uniref:uncharacterized protein LOC132260415 n=1 Tax=Phlebotomus argentipes TaxID=94469 RepID=UPI0028933948|nr:uncharacterized protein LOC132260415 [Phlebotomus argentipes]
MFSTRSVSLHSVHVREDLPMQVFSLAERLMVIFASILLLLVILLLIHWCFKQFREYRKRQEEDTYSNACNVYIIESNLGGSQRRNPAQEAPPFDTVVFKCDGLPSYDEAMAHQRDQQAKTAQTSC